MRTFMTASRTGTQPRLRLRGALIVAALISVLVPSAVTAQPTANSQAQTAAAHRSFLDEGLKLASAARGGAHPLRVDERIARVLKDRSFAFMWEVRDTRGTYYLVLHRGSSHASVAMATVASHGTVNYESWTFSANDVNSRVSSPRIGSVRVSPVDGGFLCNMFWVVVSTFGCTDLPFLCNVAIGALSYYACTDQDNYPPSAYLGWQGYPRGLTHRPPTTCRNVSPDCTSLQANVNLYASPSPCLSDPVDPTDPRCFYTVMDQAGRASVQPVSVIWTWGAEWPDGSVTTTPTSQTSFNTTYSSAYHDINACSCLATYLVHAYLDCIVIVPPSGYSVPEDSLLATQCGDLPVGGDGYATGAIDETYVCCTTPPSTYATRVGRSGSPH